MDHTPASRFVELLDRLGYKTQQQIADLLEIARPTAGTIVRKEKDPSFASIAKLKEQHPEVNMDWVFSGAGTALLTPVAQLPTQVSEPAPRFTTAAETVEEASAIVRLAVIEAENAQLRERLQDKDAEIAWLRGKSTPSSYAAAKEQPRMEIRRWGDVAAQTPTQECKHFIMHPEPSDAELAA
jgi:hypothetical protein